MLSQKKKHIELLKFKRTNKPWLIGPLLNWAPSLAYMVLIFVFSHKEPLLATVAGDWSFHGLDKIAHFCEFLLLFFIVYRTFNLENYRFSELKACCFSIVYCLSDEFHQSYLPYRDCEVGDVIADAAGVIVGFLVILAYNKYYKKRQTPLNKQCLS